MSVGTLYGVVATAAAAGGLSNKQGNGVIDARQKALLDSYTTLGSTEDATSTIAIGTKLPKGAIIKNINLSLSKALTSSVTLSVGDSDTAGRYLASIATTAAILTDMKGSYGVVGGFQYVIGTATGDDQILITINAANNAVAAAVIRVTVEYTMD